MDLIKQLLKQTDVLSVLKSQAGLSQDEAERFVPAATDATVQELQGGGLDLGALLGGGGVGDLLSKLDIGQIAGAAGLSAEKAGPALQQFLPVLMQFLNGQGGGIESLLGGDAGSLLSRAKGGLGKLLGGS